VVGVARRELQFQVEDASLVRCVFGAADVGVPGEKIVFEGSGRDSHGGDLFFLDLLVVLHESLVAEGLKFLVDGRSVEGTVNVSSSFFHDKYL
jgi:hypothetical protein